MKRFLSICLCIVLAVCFVGCGKRGTDMEEVQKSGKLIIGVLDNRPMTYKENDKWTGFDIEAAKLFVKELGVEAEFVPIAASEKYNKLTDYTVDCIWSGVTIGEYGQEEVSMSNSYIYNSQVLVTKSEVVKNYKDGYDVRNLQFAAQANSSGYFATAREGYEGVIITSTQDEALALVSNGEAQAAIVDGIAADALIGEGNKYSNLAKGFSYSRESFGVAFRKDSDLTKAFNDFLAENKEDKIWEIAEKYDLALS